MFRFFKNIKLIIYKKKKVKAERTKKERIWNLNFDLVIKDKNKSLRYDNIEIKIPARSLFDAKVKLREHLRRKVSFDINSVKEEEIKN